MLHEQNPPGRIYVLATMGLVFVAVLIAWWLGSSARPDSWTEAEVEILHSLWIGSLEPLPPDPTNAVADDPRAAKFGHQLFFDRRLSINAGISCATCHQPERRFTDGLGKGLAVGESKRNTPSIIGVAYSPWLFWDGRRDSLWSQAISPLEDVNEHGGSRMQYVHLIDSDPGYRQTYEEIFGPLPDFSDRDRFPEKATPITSAQSDNVEWNNAWHKMNDEDRHVSNEVYANIGKSIAAYERLLMPGPSRFDAYVEAVMSRNEALQQALFNDDEIVGLRLFIGEANCTQCHNGPLLTNHEFHNTGITSFAGEVPDKGRVQGVRDVQSDPFNCFGVYADSNPNDCAELRFARTGPELIGAMRTPSLRNIKGTSPFMHKGQMATLAQVLEHYNRAPLAMIGHNETNPLNLSRRELQQLESFLESLAAPISTSLEWLEAPMSPQFITVKR